MDGRVALRCDVDALKSEYVQRTIHATLQCGGNRRSELNGIEATQGLKWGAGGHKQRQVDGCESARSAACGWG